MKTLVSRFVEKLKIPLKWCKFNRLNINWSKTCFMFVTNKRFNLKLYPNKLSFCKEINDKDIQVSIVNNSAIKLALRNQDETVHAFTNSDSIEKECFTNSESNESHLNERPVLLISRLSFVLERIRKLESRYIER